MILDAVSIFSLSPGGRNDWDTYMTWLNDRVERQELLIVCKIQVNHYGKLSLFC